MQGKRAVHSRRGFLAASAALVLIGSAVAYAVHDEGLFELGLSTAAVPTDIVGSAALPGPDWDDIFNADGSVKSLFGGTAAAFVKDDVSAGSLEDATAFPKGGSDKNSDVVTEWNWQNASVPAKDDITNAYVYAVVNPANGHLIIYAGAEREDPSGSSHLDIEFFQAAVGLSETPPCDTPPCTFSGSNTNGDLLASLDFTNGGAFAGLSIRKRDSTQKDKYLLLETLDGEGCNTNGAFDPDSVCAYANHTTISGGAWDNYDNHGAIITDLPPNAFSEFGVDVTEVLGFTPCFSTVMVKTRSSHSFTAELKDFALNSFQQCSATVATQIHDPSHNEITGTTVTPGITIHDKAIITGTAGFATPSGTVTFKRYGNGSCSGDPAATETVALVESVPPTATTGGQATAESSGFLTTPGSISYSVVYNGDSNYSSVSLPAAQCERLTIAKNNSSVNTDIRLNTQGGTSVLNKKVDAGTVVVDVAIVSGTGTVDPTGDVKFTRYTTADCSGTGSDETVSLIDDAVDDGKATAVSSAYKTSNSEFVSYKVHYEGNTIYNPSDATVCEPICSFNDSPTLP